MFFDREDWSCQLAYVGFGNITKNNLLTDATKVMKIANFYVSWGGKTVTIPYGDRSVWDNIESNFINGSFESHKCEKENGRIVCQSKLGGQQLPYNLYDLPEFKDFSLVFNGSVIKIGGKKLFQTLNCAKYKVEDFCELTYIELILDFDDRPSTTEWKIGTSWFSNFHIVFDYSNSLIGFVGDYEDVSELTNDEKDFKDPEIKEYSKQDFPFNLISSFEGMPIFIITLVIMNGIMLLVVITYLITCYRRKMNLRE